MTATVDDPTNESSSLDCDDVEIQREERQMNIPSKCPECGSEDILQFEQPGYDQTGDPTPNWACDACGIAGYDTAERQEDEYHQIRDEGIAYEAETGFAKPWKPTVRIRPDNIDRKRRYINIDPETIFNGWVCRNIDKDT